MLTPQQAWIREFKVVPALPAALEPLLKIARNLWWCWRNEAVDLFVRIGHELWTESGHNPVRLLGHCPQVRLEELAKDESYLAAVRSVHEKLEEHLRASLWYQERHASEADCCVAYFCAEFGIHESLPIYSGGLGVLAGDHLKSASQLGVPLVGVGLFYRHGYFQQYLNADGWQQEFYPEVDFTNAPVRPLHDESGQTVRVSVEMPERTVEIAVWEARVGRVRLLLLDTNLQENSAEDRSITSQLYGGDIEVRMKQEIVLGIGGLRALLAAGLKPTVLHMNEGHAAFMALEHIRLLIERDSCAFDEARHAAAAMHVFTTHTPVPAGIDRFHKDIVQRYFADYVKGIGLDMEGLLALGRENVFDKEEYFSMAVLALRTSDAANGVSRLHGLVSRGMWGKIWPGVPEEEVPIGHVTNGVHARSWLSKELGGLLDRNLTPKWRALSEEDGVWEALGQTDDGELWSVHGQCRAKLVNWLRRVHKQQLAHRGASSELIRKADHLFDPSALTIGFARRFATYKRANLLFRDKQRLLKILCDPKRPVQIVVAGKAHPADVQGKELIRHIVHFARDNGAADRVVFVENYNIAVARYLVQGCDVWLNTPRRGLEASGTSGMKAAMNGVLNCSILDGWWDEAWEHDAGWAIGKGEAYSNPDYQDQVESQALYDLLEMQVVPLFYERDAAGVPRGWAAWMKNCIRRFAPAFNTHRMVREYVEKYYLPSHHRGKKLTADGQRGARELAAYVRQLRGHWPSVSVRKVEAAVEKPLGVRKPLTVKAEVELGATSPEQVRVQCYFGLLDSDGRIVDGNVVEMRHAEGMGDGRYLFAGQIVPANSGRFGFSIRVIPGHDDLAHPFMPGLIAWSRLPKPAATLAETPVEAVK